MKPNFLQTQEIPMKFFTALRLGFEYIMKNKIS